MAKPKLELMKDSTDTKRITKNEQYFKTEHLKADLKGHSVRGGLITLISQVCKFGFSLISNVLLARLLTPQDYGLVGMVATVTLFVSFFKDLGLSQATIQKEEITQEQVSTLFWINVALGIATTFITVALAPVAVWFYNEPRLSAIMLVSSISFVVSSLGIQHSALLTRQMQFRALVIIDIASNFIGLASGVIFALSGFGYWVLVIFPLVSTVVNTSLTWFICGWRPGLPARKSGVRSMLVFGGNLTGFNIINYFGRNLDNILIGKVWGAQQLGLYAKAYQLLVLPLNQINGPISSVAVPTLSRLVDTPKRYRQAYLKIIEKALIIAIPLMVFMISTSDWIIQILLGPQWKDSSLIFMLLGVAGILQPIANSTGWLFISQGRTKEMLQWGVISTAIAVLSFVIGLPWGAVGVAASYSTVWLCLTMPLLLWFVGRISPVKTKDFYLTIAPVAFAGLCTALALIAFRYWGNIVNPFLNCSIAAVITGIAFLSIMFVLPQGKLMLKDFVSLAATLKSKRTV